MALGTGAMRMGGIVSYDVELNTGSNGNSFGLTAAFFCPSFSSVVAYRRHWVQDLTNYE